MSDFDHSWKKYFKKKISPEKYIEDYLIRLEKLDSEEFEFWRDFQKFLMEEREKRFSNIQSALEKAQKFNLQETFSRIVTSNYNDDPLCVYGSICEPGRFNFGALPSYYSNFGALYLGNSEQTAHSEKFYYLENETVGEGNLTPQELALNNTPSHLYVRVAVSLENYLDLRSDEALIGFLEAVKDIEPTDEFKSRWSSLCKKADNIAIFPDNFKESLASVSLVDIVASVPSERTSINSSNYVWFSKPLSEIRQLSLTPH